MSSLVSSPQLVFWRRIAVGDLLETLQKGKRRDVELGLRQWQRNLPNLRGGGNVLSAPQPNGQPRPLYFTPQDYAEADSVFPQESGYSLMDAKYSQWLPQTSEQTAVPGKAPKPRFLYHMYDRGDRSWANMQRWKQAVNPDLAARTEGHVINPGEGNGGWPAEEFSGLRTPFANQPGPHQKLTVETSPQLTIVHRAPTAEIADRFAKLGASDFTHNGSDQLPANGNWEVPDFGVIGDVGRTPQGLKPIVANWRKLSSGAHQMVYTKDRALPGFNQSQGYVHPKMHDLLS